MEHYRITPEASVYYITYTVIEWLPAFVSEPANKIITDSLRFCHDQKGLRINAYVIMPTHLHAIVFDKDHNPKRLDQTLTDFRRFTGRSMCDYCSKNGPKPFADAMRSAAIGDRERRFWQPSRHPVAIQTEPFWQVKLKYLHDNPVRKGLVRQPDHWRYSSAPWYASEGTVAGDVPLALIDW